MTAPPSLPSDKREAKAMFNLIVGGSSPWIYPKARGRIRVDEDQLKVDGQDVSNPTV